MRPCKDEKAREAQCVPRALGTRKERGEARWDWTKMSTSLIGDPGGPLQGESRAAHPGTLVDSEGWQRKEPR